ncbi:hypothetical protein [Actinomadura fulvescens]
MDEATFAQVSEHLRECSDGEALLADGFDDALIGTCAGWFGNARRVVALYDINRCLQVLMRDGLDEEDAEEWLEYNLTGAYVGPGTPVFAVIIRSPILTPLYT